jgi:hypothetical protein
VLVAGAWWSAVVDTTFGIATACWISWSATTSKGSMSCCARERTTAPSALATRKVTKALRGGTENADLLVEVDEEALRGPEDRPGTV